ncbi:methyltransferase [Melioribacteraceae bacterium 4301-Me]|uniref:methyltransferase n=1 Tax=Pyranulibacter aquaticus TaxID=3163344 RepID=UPI003598DD43
MREINSPEQIREIAYAFQESRILLTAVELKIFTYLDGHMKTSEEISESILTDKRATNRLMNALCGMGLLRKVKGKFYNSEVASKYLVESKPEFMAGLFHTNHLWDNWSYLTESVKKGNSAVSDQSSNNKGKDWTESFIAAMHYRAVKQSKLLAMMINLKNVNKVLDVGGGSGAFSMGLINSKPEIHATIFDLPNVIRLTKKYVEQADLSDKFSFVEGNYLIDEFNGKYDLILLSAVIHINSYTENKNLINKCAEALNPNGMIVINDFIMNEDRTKPYHSAVFALNMLVSTKHGDTYTETEIREWFTAAKIEKVELKPTSFGTSLMIGYKK